VCSVYGVTGQDAAANAPVLQAVRDLRTQLTGGFAIGGDFNLVPRDLEGELRFDLPQWFLANPGFRTCRTNDGTESELDYFLLCPKIGCLARTVKVENTCQGKPHWGVSLTLDIPRDRNHLVFEQPPRRHADQYMGAWQDYVPDWQRWHRGYATTLVRFAQIGSRERRTAMADIETQALMAEAYMEWTVFINKELQERHPTEHPAAANFKFRNVAASQLYAPPRALRPLDGLIALLIPAQELGTQLGRRTGCPDDRRHMGRLWARYNQLASKEEVPPAVAARYQEWMARLQHGLRCRLRGRSLPLGFEQEFREQCEQLRRQLRQARAAQWQQFITKQLAGDAGLLHRMTQDIGVHAYAMEQGPGGVMTTSTMQQLAGDSVRWAKQWACTSDGESGGLVSPWAAAIVALLAALAAEDIRHAARKFRAATANPEGLSPREVGCLSTGASEALAIMMNAWEVAGSYPPQLEELLVRMIAKKCGGSRPILIFRTLFRIHMRIRQAEVRRWELEHGMVSFNNAPKRRITDSSYDLMVRAQTAASRGKSAAELMFDFEKFFDSIDRALLWKMAPSLSGSCGCR
jgi:hypothetical protein